MTSAAELTFGSVPLLSPNPPWADYAIEATAEGTTWGNPAAVVATVASMLMDGDKAKITRFGNREATVPLQIRGATLDAVAAGEAEVMAEVNRGRNTLTWSPPGWSTPSVFDVVYAVLDFKYDDLAEKDQVTRFFTLTLVCLPFARRVELTTVTALALTGSPTVTSIDACTSTTGWTAPAGGSVSTAGGAVVISGIPLTVGYGTTFPIVRDGLAAAVSVDEYVRVDIESGLSPAFSTNGDNVSIAAIEWTTATRRRIYFHSSSTTLSTLQLRVVRSYNGADTAVKIHDISKVDQLPVTGTVWQRSFMAAVGGTARTPADIILEADAGVGDEVLVYTAPTDAAIDPPMRRWATTVDGGDATAVSGKVHDLGDSPYTMEIPANLIPSGTHLIVGRLKLGSGGPLNVNMGWEASLLGSPWAPSSLMESGQATVTVTTTYTCFALGVATLPPAVVDADTAAVVKLKLDALGGEGVAVDDALLFNLDTGVLTWLTDLTVGGETPSKVEIRSATLDRDTPSWVVGTAETDVDNVDASARATSPGVHQINPGLTRIYVMTPGASGQSVSIELHERFRHHVPPLGS